MLDIEPYINAFSDGLIVMRGNAGEYFGSTIEPERIDEFGTTERSIGDDAARKKNPSTNRIGDKTFARSMMEVVRAIPLLDFSVKHDADFVSHGKGLVLVVRNQYNGHALAFKNVAHFDRQTLAQVNVKI